jgi:hypothetical protein
MVTADEIRDEKSLMAWLKSRPREDALVIAVRAALRVAPFELLQSRHVDSFGDLTAVQLFRALIISQVAARRSNISIMEAAWRADAYVRSARTQAAGAGSDVIRAAANDVAFASATDAVVSATRAVENDEDIWKEVRRDADLLASGQDPLVRPLWEAEPPAWFSGTYSEMQHTWGFVESEDWSLFLRWWDGILSGEQVDWALQEKVALIPNEVWEQGPGAVAEAIEKRRKDLAFGRSDNAERIEINPDTGKLRLVPDAALPEDIADYARRKIDKALDLFGNEPANQYTGLTPAFRVLRSAREEASNLPVELFDACASASRLTVGLARQGDCPTPEQDALVQDFLTRIREAGADILANDPKTQAVLERRNSILGNDALIEGRDAIVPVTAEVAVLSEGRLASGLPEDSAVATDPQADPEERKAASFRLAGRLLRVGKIATRAVSGAGRMVVAFQKVLDAIAAIKKSPLYQQAVEYILRWINF